QRMESGLAEALLGYRLDPVAGPVVVLGAGGVLTEIYNDAAVRAAPVDIETARTMIEEVRGLAPILGYRGQREGDVDALAAAVAAVSALALADGPVVLEAEINPLMVKEKGQGKGGGAVAVDGLIVLAEAVP
ncbi:MAG: acetate--CoA ligase family protein, partial [Alphaproteobacteria bacterium]